MTKPDAQQAEQAAIARRAIESFRASVLADLAKRSQLGGRPIDTLAQLSLRLSQLMGDARQMAWEASEGKCTNVDRLRMDIRERLVAIAALTQLAAREIGVEDEIPF